MLSPGLHGHTRGAPVYGRAARGLVLRGVVTRVYYLKSAPAGLVGAPPQPAGLGQAGLYCDVLVSSGIPGARTGLFPRVLVTYDSAGVHDGDICVPRPTRRAVGSGITPREEGNTSPALFDGDWVLIGFMDDSIDQPFILRYLRHPSADFGKDMDLPSPVGSSARLGLIEADGRPRQWKHLGVTFGVDRNANWTIDLRGAHLGERGDGTSAGGGGYSPVGAEVPNTRVDPAGDAESGKTTVRLPAKAKLTFEFESGRKIELTDRDGKLVLACADLDIQASGTVKLGTGAVEKAVLGDQLKAWLDAVKVWLDAHTHVVSNVTAGTGVATATPSITPTPVSPLPASALSASVTVKS